MIWILVAILVIGYTILLGSVFIGHMRRRKRQDQMVKEIRQRKASTKEEGSSDMKGTK